VARRGKLPKWAIKQAGGRKPGDWHVADGGEPLHPSAGPHAKQVTHGEKWLAK